MMRWRRVYVWTETLSCTPRLRYDRRMEHALSPTPDTLYAHALKLHAGDRAVLAGFREAGRLAGGRPEAAPAEGAGAGHAGRPRRRWAPEAGAPGRLMRWAAHNERRGRDADR
jgi:hypothetical protein